MKKNLSLLFLVLGFLPALAQSTFELTGPESLCAGSAVTLTANNCTGTLLWSTGATSTSITVSPTSTTTYYATCTVSGVKTVSSISPIVLPALTLSSNTGQCFNVGITTLSVAGAPSGSTFTWKKDGVPVGGATAANFTPTQAGNYTAEMVHNGEWTWQNPLPHGHTFNDVHFADANVGIAVGDYGTIVRTTDGGATWSNISSGTTYPLRSVHFVNASLGFVCGDGAILLKTTDGGLTWTIVSTPYSSLFYYSEIIFSDANNGWILIGFSGSKILRTVDGGNTWTLQNTGASGFQSNGIHFVSASTGWVVGDNGILKKTTDGGITWSTVSLGTTDQLVDVFFVSSTHGWVVSPSGSVYRTTDGGTTWSNNSALTACRSVHFTSTMVGYLASYYGIFKTTDGGVTWIPVSNNTSISSVFVLNSNTVCGVGANATLLRTTNGGVNWNQVFGEGNRNIRFTASEFVSDNTGWITGPDGYIAKTSNGGKTWVQQNSGVSINLYDVDFIDNNTGWVSGEGVILKTTNGGATWVTQFSTPPYEQFAKIQFIDANSGWSISGNKIFRTTNGGATWTSINIGQFIRGFHFTSNTIGWIVGEYGFLGKTTDGGQTWSSVSSGTTQNLAQVYFKDANNGWISGSNLAMRTTDGGNTWSSQSISGYTYFNFYNIIFINNNVGYAGDGYEVIFTTSDGGNSWQTIPVPKRDYANSLHFSSSNHGSLIYPNGGILKYTKVVTTCPSNTVTLASPPAAPTITGNNTQNVVCSGTEVTLMATGCSGTLIWGTGATTGSIVVSPTASTTYVAYCRNAQGCQSTGSFELPVMTQPVLSSAGPLCANNNTQLSAAGLSATSLQWLRNGMSFANPQSSSFYANEAGTYTLQNKDAGTWTLQNPLPTDKTFYDVQMIDSQTAYAVGDGGIIYKTTDGGNLWLTLSSGTANPLYDVNFVNATTGYVAGRNTLLKTTDGGSTWQSLPIGSQSSWRSVYFTDANNGVIASEWGSGLRRTTDGGATWTTPSGNTSTSLYGLHFVNATTGWATGNSGLILKTTNGGASWTAQASGTTGSLVSVFFSDVNNGWVTFGWQTNVILKTTNGGSTWSQVTMPFYSEYKDVQFFNAMDGYVIAQSTLCITQNGGISWSTKYITDTQTLSALHFLSSSEGMVAGNGGAIVKTANSGNTWQVFGQGIRDGIENIQFTTTLNGWIVGLQNLIAKTDDGGKSWTKLINGTINNSTYYFSALHMLNNTTGWVGGTSVIVKTTNGGTTWSTQYNNSSVSILGLHFINANTGWGVGSNGTILTTANGGTAWATQNSGTTQSLIKVYFINASTGWAVGNNGTILKTDNGGANWTPQSSGTAQQLKDIYFADANNGWTGGSNNTLLKTTDGGSTWIPVTTVGQNFSVSNLQFFSANEGWFGSYQGAFYTADGGNTWQVVSSPSSLSKISFITSNTGWAFGNNTSILKFHQPTAPCTSNAIAIQPSPNVPTITSSANMALCQGESVTLTATGCSGTLGWSTGDNTSSITVVPAATTTYTAACTGGNGCKSVAYAGVAVINKPHLDSTITGVCQTLNFRAENVPSTSSIIWKKDGTTLSGVNGTNYTASAAGTYGVEQNVAGAWRSQMGQLTPNTLTDVVFAKPSLGIAVGDNGTILRTSNGGMNWQSIKSGTMNYLYQVQMLNASVGWIAASNRTILKTTDGGLTWIKLKEPNSTSSFIYRVAFATENTGWFISGNQIYYTSNGGVTWALQHSAPNSLNDIKIIDATNAWVVGYNGLIVKTTNGGSSWSIANANTTQELRTIEAANTSTIWVAGANGTMLKTTDGGSTWAALNTLTAGFIQEIQFFDANNGWFKANNQFYRTTNGGTTWSLMSTVNTNITGYPSASFMKNMSEGVFVSGNSNIAQTTDGAVTWTPISSAPSLGFNDVHFTSASTGFAVGFGVLAKTTNGGEQWAMTTIPSNSYYDIFFANATHGWTVGYNQWSTGGAILATTDGGQTWQPQASRLLNYPTLRSVYFIDSNTGWIVGDNGTIIKTTNGGSSWVQKTSGTSNALYSVHFINANQGWAVGSSGAVLTTTNGGDTWTAQSTGTTYQFNSVQFTDSNTGWITTSSIDDGLYKTTNGGATWVKQDIDPTAYNGIQRVQFQNATTGWVLGSNFVFATTDGGATWRKSLHYYTSMAMHFVDSNNGWAVGNKIMRFQAANPCISEPVVVNTVGPATIQTIKSGDWQDPTVWSCGQVPLATQNTLVKSPHVINVLTTTPAKCKNILIEPGSVFNTLPGANFEASAWR